MRFFLFNAIGLILSAVTRTFSFSYLDSLNNNNNKKNENIEHYEHKYACPLQIPVSTTRAMLNKWYRTTTNEQSLTDCMVFQAHIQTQRIIKENEEYCIVYIDDSCPQFLIAYIWDKETHTIHLLCIAAMFINRTKNEKNNLLSSIQWIQKCHSAHTIDRSFLYKSQPFWRQIFSAYDLYQI